MHSENHPLPKGWVKEFDRSSGTPFFVDTNANPPRSIWTHPYDDEVYLSNHPEVRENGGKQDGLAPPSFEEATRRHSFPGQSSSGQGSSAVHGSDSHLAHQKKKGFLSKMKDKAIGTKEERAEAKRKDEEYRRQLLEMRAQQMRNRPQQMYAAPGGYGGMNNMGGYGAGRGMGMGMGGMGGYPGPGYGGRRGGGGMGGMALPLVGGLAGGLLLGDMMDGGLNDSDYGGGGDFGGGDFGGGGDF